jgi:hypothetical protein
MSESERKLRPIDRSFASSTEISVIPVSIGLRIAELNSSRAILSRLSLRAMRFVYRRLRMEKRSDAVAKTHGMICHQCNGLPLAEVAIAVSGY